MKTCVCFMHLSMSSRRGGILTFSNRLLSNSLPPGKNVRSNITKFSNQRNDLWSRARTKIQISLPPGQQENSNALPPGQSDRSKSRAMSRLSPPPAGLTLIGALRPGWLDMGSKYTQMSTSFSWTSNIARKP